MAESGWAGAASGAASGGSSGGGKLKKELGLFDVYAISTGAMFSSGFFLLPGLAAAKTGPSVLFAYVLAGVLMVPAMCSMAELCTALPRSGGMYYFLDRSLGPLVGTVGGLSTWLALVFKSAFALIGLGAYLAIFMDLPRVAVAVVLAAAFMLINLFGAKETTGLLRWLVTILLVILWLFIVQGFFEVTRPATADVLGGRLTPFFNHGLEGLVATIGFVFVSFGGLVKIAGVSEEVKRPDRTIPLGMLLSLLTATAVYGLGVFIMVSLVDAGALQHDLTPVATVARRFTSPWARPVAEVAVVVAAVAAFAATANAGILSASRYPMAMARDRLIPSLLGRVGRFNTPAWSVLVTGAVLVVVILGFDAATVAKLGSAFLLLVLGLVNLAVIVMRESRIASYDPGFRSPFYPWTQIAGFVISFALIGELGTLPVFLACVVIGLSFMWYFYFVDESVDRSGAIYHWFERLGRKRYEALDQELRGILKEKGLRDADPFDQVVASAQVIDHLGDPSFEDVTHEAARLLAGRQCGDADTIAGEFLQGTRIGVTPVTGGVALPHIRRAGLDRAYLVIVRSVKGIAVTWPDPLTRAQRQRRVFAIFFLASAEEDPGQHLRILAQIAGRVEDPGFVRQWTAAANERQLKEILLRDERYIALSLTPHSPASPLIGRTVRDSGIPEGCLVAIIQRADRVMVPRPGTRLEAGDRLTLLGEPPALKTLRERFGVSVQDSDTHATPAEEDRAGGGDAEAEATPGHPGGQ